MRASHPCWCETGGRCILRHANAVHLGQSARRESLHPFRSLRHHSPGKRGHHRRLFLRLSRSSPSMCLQRAEGQCGSPASPCGVLSIGSRKSVERYSRALLAATNRFQIQFGPVDFNRITIAITESGRWIFHSKCTLKPDFGASPSYPVPAGL